MEVSARSKKENETDKYVAYDLHSICEKCSFELVCSEDVRNCSVNKRPVSVHTLCSAKPPKTGLH